MIATATNPAHALHASDYINETAYINIKNRVIREMVEIVKPSSVREEAADASDKHFCYDDL